MELIKSRDNAGVKDLIGLLTRKKERDLSGCFVIEGVRLCLDAAAAGVKILAIYMTELALEQHPRLNSLAHVAGKALLLDDSLCAKISDTKSPQGVFCICEKINNKGWTSELNSQGSYLVLDNLQDPGNFGTILRTAQALGVDGVFACNCPDLYSPKVLRSAMGGVFKMPVAENFDSNSAISTLLKAQIKMYAAAVNADARLPCELDFSSGCGIVIGNEGEGLSNKIIKLCSNSVKIPMHVQTNSLNAATASAILLWEMQKGSLEAGN